MDIGIVEPTQRHVARTADEPCGRDTPWSQHGFALTARHVAVIVGLVLLGAALARLAG